MPHFRRLGVANSPDLVLAVDRFDHCIRGCAKPIEYRLRDLIVAGAVVARKESDAKRVVRFQRALDRWIERIAKDRWVLAVVLVGSLNEETIWRRESLRLWIIEADGVTRRLLSDGKEERVFRILAEDNINLFAELIPRARFKQMVEGSSRTAFSCNFFAERKLVHCNDPSIANWFDEANQVAAKDREKELLTFTTWTIHAHQHAEKRLQIRGDVDLARQEVIEAAHSVAHTEVIRQGEVCESDVIYKAIESNPELFEPIYLEVLKRKSKKVLATALERIDHYLDQHYQEHLKPLLAFLAGQHRMVPLSEISDHFAFSQLYPWHLVSACDWLERKGRLEKLSAPFKLTRRSGVEVEEPAYFFDD